LGEDRNLQGVRSAFSLIERLKELALKIFHREWVGGGRVAEELHNFHRQAKRLAKASPKSGDTTIYIRSVVVGTQGAEPSP